MKRHRNHVLEDLSLVGLQKALPPMWVIHPFHKDYGIDVQVELFDENGYSTGLRIYGQLKATDNREDEDLLALDREHFAYWAAHTDPVALFRCFAGSGAIKWCWMHDLEWRMRPSAESLDVSSHLIPWEGAESASAIIRLAKLRAESLRQRLTPPVSISVRSVGGGLAESLELAKCVASLLPSHVFEVLGEASSQCHYDVVLDGKKLCVGHLGLPGYVVSVEDNFAREETAEIVLLLTFLIAVRYDRTLVARGINDEVLGYFWKPAAKPFLPFVLEGLMGTLGIERAVSRILERVPESEDQVLWFSLMAAGTRASQRYGEVNSWLKLLKSWADTPPSENMRATAAYNYANHLENAGLAQWEEAERYYLIAAERDSAYHSRDYYWGELGCAQFEAGKFEAAVASYQQSMNISPCAATQWRLGDAMFHCGNYEGACAVIAQAANTGESIGSYPLLVLEVCRELFSRWSISRQAISPVSSEVYDQLVAVEYANAEAEIIAVLQPFMNVCAVDPLLTFNAGHIAIKSDQPQVAVYRFLTCALRQRHDTDAWALALVSALQAGLWDLLALIATSAYFYSGEDLMTALMKTLPSPPDAGDSAIDVRQLLIDLIRSTKIEEQRSFDLRVHGANEVRVLRGVM